MALPKQESFTAAVDNVISTYDANWTTRAGNLTVYEATDICKCTTSRAWVYWSGDAFSNDQYAQMKLTDISNCYIGIGVRMSDGTTSGHGYYFIASTADSYFGKRDEAVWTDIGGDRGAFADGDVIRTEFSGDTWTLKKNGGTLASNTDATFASGAAGICSYVSGADQMDDWEGGNLGGGGRTVMITRAKPLGVMAGMNFGVQSCKP